MRILFVSNAPWMGTGYGVQGNSLMPEMKKLGHEMAYHAFVGLRGAVLRTADGVPVFPAGILPWGEDIVAAHVQAHKADAVITLMDIWQTDYYGRIAEENGFMWIPWFPVDMVPVPPMVVEKLEKCTRAVVYSRFGEQEMQNTDYAEVTRYVPHGVDPGIFKPGDQMEAREVLGLPQDKFIIGMVAANNGYPDRKSFTEQFLAFAELNRQHPDTFLYTHTLVTRARDGVDLIELAKACGIPADAYGFCNQYKYTIGMPATAVASTYQAIDLLANASKSEGFGLPILEAQACGTPVVAGHWTSMPELVVNGWTVKKSHRMFTPLNAWVFMPDVEELGLLFKEAYDLKKAEPESWRTMSQVGVSNAVKGYNWHRVVTKYWKPVLEEVAG